MRNEIELSEISSLRLFSGFSGAGKTTQLLRLKKELKSSGYLVIYADAEDYLNLGEPVDISDLLYTVAGAFSVGLEELGVKLPKGESYWSRFYNYLTRTKVDFKEFTVSAGVDLKAELHTSTTFRERLQQHLSGHLRELASETRSFVEEGLQEVREQYGGGTRVVFILDSLEKLRATPSNEQGMMDRLERLFRNHLYLLEFESLHCVYTVPAWLREVIRTVRSPSYPASNCKRAATRPRHPRTAGLYYGTLYSAGLATRGARRCSATRLPEETRRLLTG
ncbi:MAG: hypothetical protein JNK48_21590 [Bryobacterales bacterium]|nr:hypothetical protein [Bryobacterales bacterium]